MKLKICFLVLGLLLAASPAMPQGGLTKITRGVKSIRTSSWKAPKPPKPPKTPRVSTSVSGFKSRQGFGSIILPGVGHAIQNGDNDSDSKRKGVAPGIGVRRIEKPLSITLPRHHFSNSLSNSERIDESMAKDYPAEKELIDQGKRDSIPKLLFVWASFAKRRGLDKDAVEIMGHIDPETLTPAILHHFSKHFIDIQDYGPGLVYQLNARAYLQMLKAKYDGKDSDSARMQGGDTLLIVTGKYLPFLKPLTRLSCIYDPAKEMERYKVAADALIANYNSLPREFREVFFSDFLSTLYGAKEYQTALDYFERESLKSLSDSNAEVSLKLASCAWDTPDEQRFSRYINQAEKIDSIAADEFLENFHNNLLDTLADAGQYQTALDYYEREPLKSLSESNAEVLLKLASCAWEIRDEQRFFRYIKQAGEIDIIAANEYLDNFRIKLLESFLADPSQIFFADWLLENSTDPMETALSMALDISERYFLNVAGEDWEWSDKTTCTPKQLAAADGAIHILDRTSELDNSHEQDDILIYRDLLKIPFISLYEERMAEALEIIDRNCRALKKNPSAEAKALLCNYVLLQAFFAGHGVDNPKEALKILKKNTKLLKAPEVSNETRSDWYSYMVVLADRLGKTKDAAKYLKLKESLSSQN